jgi:NADH-quinone oxidoreductase subunit C
VAEEKSSSQENGEAAGSALSERGQALQRLLRDVLSDFQPEMGTVQDIPEIVIKPADIADACRVLKDEPRLSFKLLLCLAAVDYVEYSQMVYVFLSLEHEHKLLVKTNVPYDDPHLPTLTSLWRSADWYEREAHDLFGVVFDGHPNLQPLILYEGFDGYPGRKEHPFHDYQEF